MAKHTQKVVEALATLNRHKVRATYTAMGEYAGLPARSVSRYLGDPRPEASWVVGASNKLPSRYSREQMHPDLLSKTHVITRGVELARLVNQDARRMVTPEPPTGSMRIAGIDLAWNTDKNGSGIAIGRLTPAGLHIESAQGGVIGVRSIAESLALLEELSGVAIDAPLIIRNKSGYRPCEQALSDAYRSRWAGCHPSNLTRFPDAGSVKLSHWLAKQGYEHLARDGKWQIEVYPHPAIVEIFSLERRLAYKKGNAGEKRAGQKELATLLCSLADSPELRLSFDEHVTELLSHARIDALPVGRLKDSEDMLDAIICCYVGGLFASGLTRNTFGDATSGYIVVP